MSNKQKTLFIIQGEGRGHLTQSLSLYGMIYDSMDVCEVIVGKSPQRQLPDFFSDKIKSPITQLDSPNFSVDSKGKGIKMFSSIINNILRFNTFRRSLKIIDETIKKHKPDLIINFYEPLMGLYFMLYKPKNLRVICIGHQYLFNHSEFEFPKGHFFDRTSLKLYTSLTCFGAYKKLALSFYKFDDDDAKGIYIVPPLLRDEVFCQIPTKGDYLLVYLVNSGYLEDIIDWHLRNRHFDIHLFTDSKHDEYKINENFTIHKLNDKKFLSMMSGCKALICTAGFESVSEALYLKKQVLMVPVEGHFEQYLNSIDGVKAGAGIRSSKFNISKLTDYVSSFRDNNDSYRNWVDSARTKILSHLK